MSDTPLHPSDSTSNAQAYSLDGMISLHDCLREINHALNYWYPLKNEASEEERNARHVRLFQFRDRLKQELNDSPPQHGGQHKATPRLATGAAR